MSAPSIRNPEIGLELGESPYSIRAVAQKTGLSAHVIRVWERRYSAVAPVRSDGNARRFSEADIERLSLMRRLTERGHAIGVVARLSTPELLGLDEGYGSEGLVSAAAVPSSADSRSNPLGGLVESYLQAVEGLRTTVAYDILSRAANTLNRRSLAYDVLLPIVRETGEAWQVGRFSVVHEHVVSVQVEGLLHALRNLAARAGPRMLVTTPSGHRHALGAMMGSWIAAAVGFEVIYLGCDLPDPDILQGVDTLRPEVLLLSVVRDGTQEELRALEVTLSAASSRVETWVAHPAGHSVSATRAKVRHVEDFQTFETQLASKLAQLASSGAAARST